MTSLTHFSPKWIRCIAAGVMLLAGVHSAFAR